MLSLTGQCHEIRVKELKALFFVKDFAGVPAHQKRREFDPAHPISGRKIRIVFTDGEVLVGVTQGYLPNRAGFFVQPADVDSNNERCFVVASATKEVAVL